MISDVRECYLCKCKYNLQVHHLIPGRAYRKKCEEDGLKVYLCNECHWLVHNKPKVNDNYLHLKQVAQKEYIKSHSINEWISRYNKNYL